MTLAKAEVIIPRLDRTRFTREKYAKELETLPVEAGLCMLELKNSWRIVGWAKSADVMRRDGCPYVGLFRRDDGLEAWIHMSKYPFVDIAEKIQGVI